MGISDKKLFLYRVESSVKRDNQHPLGPNGRRKYYYISRTKNSFLSYFKVIEKEKSKINKGPLGDAWETNFSYHFLGHVQFVDAPFLLDYDTLENLSDGETFEEARPSTVPSIYDIEISDKEYDKISEIEKNKILAV